MSLLSKPENKTIVWILALASVCWLSVYVFFILIDFNLLRSDVESYWSYGQVLGEFNVYHLPAYPIVLKLLDLVIPAKPITIMQLVAFIVWIAGIFSVYSVLNEIEASHEWLGALMYGIFPFVGVVNSVFPLSDTIAMCCFVIGVLGYLRGKKWMMVFAWGTGLLVHKIIWVFISTAILIGFYEKRIKIWMIIFIGVPLGVYWLLGWQHHLSPTWMFSSSFESASAHEGGRSLPIFDAVVGGAFEGTIKGIFQTLIVLPIYIIAWGLFFSFQWKKTPILLAFIAPILVIGTLFDHAYVFLLVRYGFGLVIPIWAYLSDKNRLDVFQNKAWSVSVISMTIASQFLWGLYISQMYFK